MIDLTPLEVRKKKGDFRRAMRGYDAQAVDDFLDLVADRLEQLVRENATLSERASAIEGLVSDYRERERALTEALVTAQEMREDMRRQMEREVEIMLREAETNAENIRSTATQAREREEEVLRKLRARQNQFLQSYRMYLERELAELAVISESLDFSKRAEQVSGRPVTNAESAASAKTAAVKKPATAQGPASANAAKPAAAAVKPTAKPAAAQPGKPISDTPPPEAEEESAEKLPLLDVSDFETLSDYQAETRASADGDGMRDPAEDEMILDQQELVDERAKDDDEDGWVSTLLEGKGD